jgi:RNA recognition motif-containing protein
LEESIDSEALHHTFSAIGVVLSCKVQRDRSKKSLGYGFIQFQDEEDAQRAIRLVNGKLLEGKKVYVGPFIPRSPERLAARAVNLNPAHVPAQVVSFNEAVSSTSSSNSSVRIPYYLIIYCLNGNFIMICCFVPALVLWHERDIFGLR